MKKSEMKRKIKSYQSTIDVLREILNECKGYAQNERNEDYIRESEGMKCNTLNDTIDMLEEKISYLEIHWDDDKLTYSEKFEMELIHNNID